MAMTVGAADEDEDAMNAAINTTPLVDIMLVLLIIFLITTPVITHSVTRIVGVPSGISRMRLKSVKPLLPPKPVSLRKKSSMAAKVSACVMMLKYTPLMRERKAK